MMAPSASCRHRREMASIDQQTVIRMNRDTLYSFGVFDLDAAPVTITLPDAGKRYMSMQVINEDHYTHGSRSTAPGRTRSRRTRSARATSTSPSARLSNPNDPQDVKAAHALQDAIKVEQARRRQVRGAELGPGVAEPRPAMRSARAAARRGPASSTGSARRTRSIPFEHLLGTAAGWGGNPRHARRLPGRLSAERTTARRRIG